MCTCEMNCFAGAWKMLFMSVFGLVLFLHVRLAFGQYYSGWTKVTALPAKGYFIQEMSGNGQYLYSIVYGAGGIYRSADYGATFSQISALNPNGDLWAGFAVSYSGQYAVASNHESTGGLWYTNDYGVTWTLANAPTNGWGGRVACSSDGKYFVAQAFDYIYYSSNYGVDWTQSNSPAPTYGWLLISLTSSGQIGLATTYDSNMDNQIVYSTTDYGVTWTSTNQAIYGVPCGTGSFASMHKGSFYRSADNGYTWTKSHDDAFSPASYNYFELACDTSGQRLAGSVNANGIWTSFDGGTTWALLSGSSGRNYDIAMDSDGWYLASAKYLEQAVYLAHFNTPVPTAAPTRTPTAVPTATLTDPPTAPTFPPSGLPTVMPTFAVTAATKVPTTAPTEAPTVAPTKAPTVAPTKAPTVSPTKSPTATPTRTPTATPSTKQPSNAPTQIPTASPTFSPGLLYEWTFSQSGYAGEVTMVSTVRTNQCCFLYATSVYNGYATLYENTYVKYTYSGDQSVNIVYYTDDCDGTPFTTQVYDFSGGMTSAEDDWYYTNHATDDVIREKDTSSMIYYHADPHFNPFPKGATYIVFSTLDACYALEDGVMIGHKQGLCVDFSTVGYSIIFDLPYGYKYDGMSCQSYVGVFYMPAGCYAETGYGTFSFGQSLANRLNTYAIVRLSAYRRVHGLPEALLDQEHINAVTTQAYYDGWGYYAHSTVVGTAQVNISRFSVSQNFYGSNLGLSLYNNNKKYFNTAICASVAYILSDLYCSIPITADDCEVYSVSDIPDDDHSSPYTNPGIAVQYYVTYNPDAYGMTADAAWVIYSGIIQYRTYQPTFSNYFKDAVADKCTSCYSFDAVIGRNYATIVGDSNADDDNDDEESSQASLSTGAIVGVVLGAVFGLCILPAAALGFCCCRRQQSNTPAGANSAPDFSTPAAAAAQPPSGYLDHSELSDIAPYGRVVVTYEDDVKQPSAPYEYQHPVAAHGVELVSAYPVPNNYQQVVVSDATAHV